MAKNTLKVVGASNHTDAERSKLDYYGTDPRSTEALLEVEKFSEDIWEPASGHNLITDVLRSKGYKVFATDIADYGCQDKIINFLEKDSLFTDEIEWDGDIVTNPPYGLSTEFACRALEIVKPGRKVAMFLRTLFLEGTKRYDVLFKENPPKVIYVFSNRQVSDKNDDFDHGSAVSYSWFVWEKGSKSEPIIKWIKSK